MIQIPKEQLSRLTAPDGRRKVECYASILRNGAEIDRIPCGGSVTLDTEADIERTANLSIGKEYDWISVEIQPVVVIEGDSYPLGRFLPTSPEVVYSEMGTPSWEVECYDRTLILEEDKLTKDTTYPAGEKYLDVVAEILYLSGIHDVIIYDPSDAVLPIDRTFERGTSKLEIINTLLDEIVYNKIRCDAEGNFYISAYQEPKLETAVITYEAGAASVLLAEAEITTDYYNKPNVYSVMVDNPELEQTFYSEYINDNPGDPLSTVRRGRMIVADEDEINPPEVVNNQADLDKWLKRRAFEMSREYQTVKYTTLAMPVQEALDQIILHLNEKISGLYIEMGWEIKLQAGGLMTHTARRAYSAG